MPLSERRPLGDRGFQILTLVHAAWLVLVILVLIAITTSQQASSWFSTEGLKIFSTTWNPEANQYGALAFDLRHDHHGDHRARDSRPGQRLGVALLL